MTKTIKAYTMDTTRSVANTAKRVVRDTMPARKTLIATFPGSAFVSERTSNGLEVYWISGDAISTEAAGATATVGDRGLTAAARLQAVNERMYPRHGGHAK